MRDRIAKVRTAMAGRPEGVCDSITTDSRYVGLARQPRLKPTGRGVRPPSGKPWGESDPLRWPFTSIATFDASPGRPEGLAPLAPSEKLCRHQGHAESADFQGISNQIGETGFEPATARPPAGIRG